MDWKADYPTCTTGFTVAATEPNPPRGHTYQRAMENNVQLLMQIYEEVFFGFSYGFRPERGVHNALDAIWVGITRRKVNWILDADVRNFFGELDHKWMVKFLEHRVGDPRILRLIKKWLRAGVSEEGEWSRTVVGASQGSVRGCRVTGIPTATL